MPDPIRPCGHDNWPPCPPVPAKTVKAVLDWHKSLSTEHRAVVESDAWHGAMEPSDSASVIVDPIEQLAMSLAWDDDYADAYKRRVITEAVQFVTRPSERRVPHFPAGDAGPQK